MEASSDLWRVENVYYPPTIRETASSSSKAGGVPEGAEDAGTVATAVSTTPDEPAKESEPSGATETGEGLSLEAPPRATESTAKAQAPHAEEPALLVEPVKLFPLARALRTSRSLLFSPPRVETRPSQRCRPSRLLPILLLFWCCCCRCFFFTIIIFLEHGDLL